jgi:hypothetical protein
MQQTTKLYGGVEVELQAFLVPALGESEWYASLPGCVTQRKTASVPTVYESGLDPDLV